MMSLLDRGLSGLMSSMLMKGSYAAHYGLQVSAVSLVIFSLPFYWYNKQIFIWSISMSWERNLMFIFLLNIRRYMCSRLNLLKTHQNNSNQSSQIASKGFFFSVLPEIKMSSWHYLMSIHPIKKLVLSGHPTCALVHRRFEANSLWCRIGRMSTTYVLLVPEITCYLLKGVRRGFAMVFAADWLHVF